MLTDVLSHLRCPVCGLPLALSATGKALTCPRQHSFDLARQGYVQLSAGPLTHHGDTAAMVAQREDFLARGHYDAISGALAVAAGGARGGLVVDVGAGTGRHLAAVLDARPHSVGLALDASRHALRRAARVHPRAAAVLCDVWRPLPLADATADVLLDVFAPRNGAEFARVLRPDGELLVVTPAPDHLAELVPVLHLLRVDPAKEDRTAGTLSPWFDRYARDALVRPLELTRAEVAALVGMGPSAWHQAPEELDAAIAGLAEPVRVTMSMWLSRYRLRRDTPQ